MLRKREQGQYFVYGMFEDNGELAGYAYFIKCSNKDVYLLDYLAIVKNKRSKHLGSTILQELMIMRFLLLICSYSFMTSIGKVM